MLVEDYPQNVWSVHSLKYLKSKWTLTAIAELPLSGAGLEVPSKLNPSVIL